MLALKDIRQYISGLGIAEDSNVYIGKMDNKKQKSIGVYSRKTSGSPNIALGGLDYTSYDIKPVSLLIHWNRHPVESEKAAFDVFEKLRTASGFYMGNAYINCLRLMVPEPQDAGTDDSGVYEYVIWLDVIYQRK